MASLDDWEDPFLGSTIEERAREFNARRAGKLAERAELLRFIAHGLPDEPCSPPRITTMALQILMLTGKGKFSRGPTCKTIASARRRARGLAALGISCLIVRSCESCHRYRRRALRRGWQ